MSLIFPIGAILVMLMLAIVPFIFNTSETVLTLSDVALVGSGIAYYVIFVMWKNKSKSYTRTMGKYRPKYHTYVNNYFLFISRLLSLYNDPCNIYLGTK